MGQAIAFFKYHDIIKHMTSEIPGVGPRKETDIELSFDVMLKSARLADVFQGREPVTSHDFYTISDPLLIDSLGLPAEMTADGRRPVAVVFEFSTEPIDGTLHTDSVLVIEFDDKSLCQIVLPTAAQAEIVYYFIHPEPPLAQTSSRCTVPRQQKTDDISHGTIPRTNLSDIVSRCVLPDINPEFTDFSTIPSDDHRNEITDHLSRMRYVDTTTVANYKLRGHSIDVTMQNGKPSEVSILMPQLRGDDARLTMCTTLGANTFSVELLTVVAGVRNPIPPDRCELEAFRDTLVTLLEELDPRDESLDELAYRERERTYEGDPAEPSIEDIAAVKELIEGQLNPDQ